jgi:hypothetical protein
MNDNGYPMLKKPSKREQQQSQEGESAKKESVKRSKSQKGRAVDRALRKLLF